MQITHRKKAKFGKRLGGGAENDCVAAKDKPGRVYKYANPSGRCWQTQSPGFLPECARTFRKRGIKIPEGMCQNIDPKLSLLDNIRSTFTKRILEETERDDLEEMAVKWKDLTDPEKGANIIQQMIDYMEKAYIINEEDHLGADPIGGGSLIDFPKILTQEFILKLAEYSPEFIQKVIQAEIAGIEGKFRNIVILPNGELEQIDIGMHDWRPEGKIKPLTRLTNNLMFAVVKEVLLAANDRLGENGIPKEEIEAAPIIPEDKTKKITKEDIIRKIAKIVIQNHAIPAFDRYDEKKESTRKKSPYSLKKLIAQKLYRVLKIA